jgi:hypothetical protein
MAPSAATSSRRPCPRPAFVSRASSGPILAGIVRGKGKNRTGFTPHRFGSSFSPIIRLSELKSFDSVLVFKKMESQYFPQVIR